MEPECSFTVPATVDAAEAQNGLVHTEHHYEIHTEWTGNRGTGTTGYRDYDRTLTVSSAGKPDIAGSADPHFFGDVDRWNPEELLVVALSQCHMLSYLHVAAAADVIVVGYQDRATGTLELAGDGGGRMTEATLRPEVTVADASMLERAQSLHQRASELCFIRASVNFAVSHEPSTRVESPSGVS